MSKRAIIASSVQPRKAPTQRRASVTHDAILIAAQKLLEQDGLPGFNTNRIAELAGVSVGSLYQYYPNKTALLVALIRADHQATLLNLETAIEECHHLPLPKAVRKVVRVAINHQFERPALAAALEAAERQLPDDETFRLLRMTFAALVQRLLTQYCSQISGNLSIITTDLLTIVQAMVDGAAMRGESPTKQLQARIERAVLGYLMR
jgi:AcrR family transcriptional regulator